MLELFSMVNLKIDLKPSSLIASLISAQSGDVCC